MGAASTTTPPAGPTRLPQRPIGGRISTGHVATIVIGLVAAVLTYAVLRGGSSVDVAFAADALRANDVITPDLFRFESLRLPAAARDKVLTRAGLADVQGGRILVRTEKGAMITTNMVTGDRLPTIRRVPLPVESVSDLRKGDLVEVGMPAGAPADPEREGELLFRVAEVVCADAGKPFNQVLYVEVPASESRIAVNLPSTGKVKVALITDPDGFRPAGPPVGPC
ncbi:MAG: SAF domain-containing protein [Actinomycetota bacterium]